MMSSWADHCSSSEDEATAKSAALPQDYDDFLRDKELPRVEDPDASYEVDHSSSQYRRSSNRSGASGDRVPQNHKGPQLHVVLPSSPPFTAFVGNLTQSVRPNDLTDELEHLAREHLNVHVRCEGARIVSSSGNRKRQQNGGVPSPQQSFFGYVEVDTVDDLAALLRLDNQVKLSCNNNRRLKIEVANRTGGPRRNANTSSAPATLRRSVSDRGSHGGHHHGGRGSDGSSDPVPEIDGTAFRGGIHGRKNSGGPRNLRGGLKRVSSVGSPALPPNPGLTRGSSVGSIGTRPSLKLAPRTKPLSEARSSLTSSDIFGGAKPRDESTWHQSKKREQVGGVQGKEKDGGIEQYEKSARHHVPGKSSGKHMSSREEGLRMGGDERSTGSHNDSRTSSAADSRRRHSESRKRNTQHVKRRDIEKKGSVAGGGSGGPMSHKVGDRRRGSKNQGASGGPGKRSSRNLGDQARKDIVPVEESPQSTGSVKRAGRKSGAGEHSGRGRPVVKGDALLKHGVAAREETKSVVNTFAALGFDSDSD